MVLVCRKNLYEQTEWHQPKIIRTTILQGGAEMAGGRAVGFPEDGRQQHEIEASVAANVITVRRGLSQGG